MIKTRFVRFTVALKKPWIYKYIMNKTEIDVLTFGEFTVEEVEAAKKVKGTNIKKVVDDPEWQGIRKSLIGNWKNNHKQNVKTLRSYFEKNKRNPLAVRRVINVLTGSVHRVGHTKGQAETDALLKDVRIHWNKMNGETYDPNDPKYKTGAI